MKRPKMPLPLLLVLAELGLMSPRPCRADVTLQDIIENVRRNEALYANVDVTMRYEYDVAGDALPKMQNGSVPGRTRTVTHYVSQDGLFRLDTDGASETSDGARSEDRVRAFDGQITRAYEQNAVGNIITGCADDGRRIEPHNLLLREMLEARVPLSIFLSGEDAVRAHPLNHLSRELDLVASYHSTTEVDGLLCHKVAVVMTTRRGEPIVRHELLLAESRNYLPIRCLSWTFRWSNDLPVAEAEVTQLKEVAPGVWYPFAARIRAFNPLALREKHAHELSWTDGYTCEKVSLDPSYPRSYFSDVKFPEGAAVYHVQDGKITSAYRRGLSPAIRAALSVVGGRWLLWALNIFAVLVVSIVFIERRRCRAKVP